jgi:signal transduction histidine kinase
MSAPAPAKPLFAPWIALVGALILLPAGVVMALYEDHLYETQRLDQTREQAEILAASVSAAVSFGDRKAADEYVEPLRVNPGIAAVGVYAKNGPLLAGFAREGSLPPPAFLKATPPTRHGDRIVVTVPVVQQSTALGMVYLRAFTEPMENRVLRYAILTLLAVLAVIVTGGLGSAQIRLQRQAQSLAEANAKLQTEMAERARAEEALRQSQKMEAIGQLSGAMAHDFNNHLMIIKGNLHFIQRKLPPGPDRHVTAAMEGINRAAALTQRILAFSRKQDLSPSELRLNEIIGDMEDMIRNSLRENIEVVRELNSDWPVVVDKNQMENVILNLVINARDAMPEGGKLFLETSDETLVGWLGDVPAGAYVRLIVRDTGAGMSDEVRAKALDPFFTTKPLGQGTGLGLSMTVGFVSQSGGYMSIDSALGRGTAIVIYLPRANGPSAAAGEGKERV